MNAMLALLLVAGTIGDEPGDEAATDEARAARTKLLSDAADSYRFTDDGADSAAYERLPKPVLRWTNPLRETDAGAMFLWTRDGRPAVGMCVYTYGDRGFDQEMVSLLPRTLVGETTDGRVWSPKTPGLAFATVPDAPPPATTAARRLLQMKAIRRAFNGRIIRGDKREFALRSIPQPFHRYGSKEGPVLDGALFGFSLGTDPEALLLVEAQRNGDEFEWRYAVTRMTTAGVVVNRGDAVVYDAARRGSAFTILEDPYNTFRGTLPATED